MYKFIKVGLIAAVIFLIHHNEASAQRGRGGRGGGMARGGMSRPMPSVARSPAISGGAMARPSAAGVRGPSAVNRAGVGAARPGAAARPAGGAGPGIAGRPSQSDVRNFLNMGPAAGAGAGAGVAGRGGAAAAFLQTGAVGGPAMASQLPAGRPGAAGSRVEQRSSNLSARAEARSINQAGRVENRQQLQDSRMQRRDEVRNQVEENHPRLDFWTDHPTWAAWRINRPYRWATWGAVAGWAGYGSSAPASYDYGEDVYYEGDTVYQGDQPVASAEEYAQQAEAIATSAPKDAGADADWLPLGVFALTQDGQASGPDPSFFLQMAISKEGIIRGTLHNTATDKTQEIEGMADKKSQRCAWTIAGETRPIMETGLASLTQESASVLVHFADGQHQQWLMVHLKDPDEEKQ